MKKVVYLYSPQASEPLGHPTYAQELVRYISKKHEVVFYTLEQEELNERLRELGATLITNSEYEPGGMDKDKFLKFGKLGKLVFGFSRIRYSYRLLKDFYKKSEEGDLFHLLEFEYFSAWVFFFFRKKLLAKTVLGFHAADFGWEKGRSAQVNIYKSLIGKLLPRLVRDSKNVTTMGVTLREKFIDNIGLSKHEQKVVISGYGNDVVFRDTDKAAARKKLNLPEDEALGLFFGVLRESKGIIELLENFSQVDSSVRLLMAGGIWDIPEEKIRGIIADRNLGDRVISRIGFIEEEDIEHYFTACDFVFLTHKKGFYSFSGPLSLSVQYRRPVVATNFAEIGYFVNRFKLGETFEPENWSDMADNTNKLALKLRENNNGEFAFNEALNYNSWEAIAERIMKTYS